MNVAVQLWTDVCSRVRVGKCAVINQAEKALHWSWVGILSDPVRLELLRALCQMGVATTGELRRHCHTSDPTVRRHLEALETLGLVCESPGERDGLTPGRPAKRWNLHLEAAAKLSVLFDLLSDPLVPSPAPGPQPPADPERARAPYRSPQAAAKASSRSSLR
jgi:DNA-binding transcriptional ArsR family regulator